MDFAAELTAALGAEVQDADEETFVLFSQPAASRDLGFVDPRAPAVQVRVAGRDLTVHQSPGLLASRRAGGTTGAVLWTVTPLLAAWLAAPANALLALVLPPRGAAVLELGCGVAPLHALALRRRAALYVLSDQPYVRRLLARNLAEAGIDDGRDDAADVCFRPLDWETDAVTAALAAPRADFDAVLACDCVFNQALVAPLVQTCADACRLRASEPPAARPCVCLVAQQLRCDDVFRAWLAAFAAVFRVWRVPDAMLPDELRPPAGFVVHVGILR